MNTVIAEATHALWGYLFVLGNLLIGYVAYRFVVSAPRSRTVRYKLGIYTVVLAAAAFFAYGAASTYGTYCENMDEYGCDQIVTIFSPTAKERAAQGWGMFFMLIGPALVGETIGLWSPDKAEAGPMTR